MLMGVATVLFGSWRRVAAYEVIRMAKAVVLLLVIANELTRPQRLVQGAIALVTSMLAESVIGVLQYARGSSLGLEKLGETATKTIEVLAVKSIVGMEVWRVSALLLHPNVFGIFLAAVLPLAIGFFVLKNGWIYKSISLLACGLGTFALLVTYSRSSWASYAAAFTLMMLLLVLHRPLRSRALVLAGVAGLVLLIMLGAFSDKIMTRLLRSQESATSARAQWRSEARVLIGERPVTGWGLNSYVDVVLPFSKLSRKAYSGWVPPVHNIYLLWWAETGIVGFGLYLLVWAAFVWTGVKNLRAGDTVLYVINAACLCGMIAFAVDGFFSLSLRINAIMRLFFVLGGMMMAIRYMLLEARCAAPVGESTAGRSTVR
jgi:O-antigen ligase